MAMFNRRDDFGWMAVSLHWLLFILIFGLIAGGKYSASLLSGEKIGGLINIHKQIGVAVFVLMAFRLLWRLINTRPEALSNVFFLKAAAFATHWLLYLTVMFQAAVGVFMSQLGGRDVHFLGWELPSYAETGEAVLGWFTGSEFLRSFLFGQITSPAKQMRELHDWVGWLIILLIVVHVLGALMHHYLAKDDTLRRMMFRFKPTYAKKDPHQGGL